MQRKPFDNGLLRVSRRKTSRFNGYLGSVIATAAFPFDDWVPDPG